jgi:hypothetical protein
MRTKNGWTRSLGGGRKRIYIAESLTIHIRIAGGFGIKRFVCEAGVRKCNSHLLICETKKRKKRGCHFHDTALLFLKEVWKHHGTPQIVVLDQGPQFVAGFTCELYKLLGIKLATSTAYHPQTDSQTERINQVLEGYLRTFMSRRQDNWDDLLLSGKFHYNNSQHLLTQQTPFMLNTGRNPHMGFEPQQPRSNLESVNKFAECMALGIEEAKTALTKAKYEYAMYYNRRREPAPVFAPGDRV